jgi:transient receptor potential cation channel subfamily C member 4
MRTGVTEFATQLLDHARTSIELEIMLNYNASGVNWEPGERQTLDRLKLAIKNSQKHVSSLYMWSVHLLDLNEND